MDINEINNQLGDADLFLIDWMLKGNIQADSRILDAGCGSGRNLLYFMQNNFDVIGVDSNESEIRALNFISENLNHEPVGQVARIQELPFENHSFEFIICSRVLHFSETTEDFSRQLQELKRVLSPRGTIYLSMASTLGIKDFETHGSKVSYRDGSIRFTLNKELLLEIRKEWAHAADYRTVIFSDDKHEETTLILTPR